MSKIIEKTARVLKKIYGYGILAALFIGGATVVGYIAAMIIGGDTATAICTFIYKTLFKWLILGADVIVLIGLLAMYLSKETSMTLDKSRKKKKSENG
ncbi:MAG: hypothetical protein CW338_11635 [Clostridiales bacterium]|nr:hypothetical protein [Clostridiales bacterium]